LVDFVDLELVVCLVIGFVACVLHLIVRVISEAVLCVGVSRVVVGIVLATCLEATTSTAAISRSCATPIEALTTAGALQVLLPDIALIVCANLDTVGCGLRHSNRAIFLEAANHLCTDVIVVMLHSRHCTFWATTI
jgi:hypothetical protein